MIEHEQGGKKLYIDKENGKIGLKICYHGSARPFSTKKPQLCSKNHPQKVKGTALELLPGLACPEPCDPKF
jgi:hypothetical protein